MNARALLAAFLLLVAFPAAAQSGLLTGTVTDMATLKPIAGVTVTATSENLQGEQVVVTDASGAYQVPQLPPGHYVLRFEAPGYQSWTKAGIALRLGSTRRVNVEMPPEDLGGCFIGMPSPPTIDVDSSRTGVHVNQGFLINIPLPSR